MESTRLPVPLIQMNGLRVIEIHGSPPAKKKKRSSKMGDKISRRKTSQHHLNTCGCSGRRLPDAKEVLDALYNLAAEEKAKMLAGPQSATHDQLLSSAQSAVSDSPDPEIPPVVQNVSDKALDLDPCVSPKKRKASVAFPGVVHSGETCLEPDEVDSETQSFLDNSDSLSRNEASESSVTTVDVNSLDDLADTTPEKEHQYDFDHPPPEVPFCDHETIRELAPHILNPTKDNINLHPRSAIITRQKPKQEPYRFGDANPLRSFYDDLANPPEEAFDPRTGGLRRAWLYETRPQLFNSDGELQEYVIHKGKPWSLSQSIWIWLCGRDERLPRCGPDPLSLDVVITIAKHARASPRSRAERQRSVRKWLGVWVEDWEEQ